MVKSNFFSLGILLLLSLSLIWITDHYILTLNFFDNSGEYLAGIPQQESDVFSVLQKYIYLSAIFYLSVKVLLVALIISTALFLAEQQVSFSRALNIAILCEYLFLVPAALKIVLFKFDYPDGTLAEWHKMYVFSALSITGEVSPDWYYPLQTLNVFEIGYWFLLAYGIFKATDLTYDESLKIILLSYVPALLIWVTIVTFCTLMVFPNYA